MKSECDFSKGKRGSVVAAPMTKEKVTIHLDRDVLDSFATKRIAQVAETIKT